MKPVGTNILVKLDSLKKGDIVLLNEPDPPSTGVIVEVGSKVDLVAKGDKVLFRDSFSSTPVPGHEGLVVMSQELVNLIL